MPAPGEQHGNSGGRVMPNPFMEVKSHITGYTAQEIATLQSRLEKQLGPEYLSMRPGPGGSKVHYVAGEKCIQLANEVFGFNGWSSQIMDMTVDFVDELPGGRINLGISVIVRVTLKDGSFHEDVGYGKVKNSPDKAAAFEKSKKEGTTDALKRALRNFGNVLGNCIYDKDYVKQVTKVKVQPSKWDVGNLHRAPGFGTPKQEFPPAKRELEPKYLEERSQNGAAEASLSTEDIFEDEFGEFDEADFNVEDPDSHPDEVIVHDPSPPLASHHINTRNGNGPPNGNGTANLATPNQNRPTYTRPQPAAGRPGNGVPHIPNNTNVAQQPQTPNTGFTRSSSGTGSTTAPGSAKRPQPNPALQPRPMQPPPVNPKTGQVLNQPSRNGRASGPASPAPATTTTNKHNKLFDDDEDDEISLPPQGKGFFSARSVSKIVSITDQPPDTNGVPPPLPPNVAAFNPHAESPSIPRTPGIDHRSTKPIKPKDLKHVISSSQAQTSISGTGVGVGRSNFVNPQLDGTRRIGAPIGGLGGGPMAGRNNGYKPPLKRPVDSHANDARKPLLDLNANGALAGGDAKRQRLSD